MGNYISGLTSGMDWTSMISNMMKLERRPIDLMEQDKTELSEKQDAWGEVNTRLLSLKSAVSGLSDIDSFDLFTSSTSVSGSDKTLSDLMNIAVGSNASQGSYAIKVDTLAQAQKLGSRSFSATDDALGLSGDILVNDHVVNIGNTDSLSDIRNKINALNTGDDPAAVTASISTLTEGEYRLTLTSQATGAEGIDVANASANDLLSQLGISDNTAGVSNTITNGARSGTFESSIEDIKTLLGLNTTQSGAVTIAGESVSIDLSTDSLQSIRDAINANAALQTKGVSASITSDTSSDDTAYSLQIDGTQSFVDTDNILQSLGILRQGHTDVTGVTGATANTKSGSAITADTLLTNIDGYNTWTSGDDVSISGTDHDGNAVGPTAFTITENSTMGDLLSAIETAYAGDVNAYVDGQGSIVVEDSRSGTSSLAMDLSSTIADSNSILGFGAFGSSSIRSREIVQAQDAQITVDGQSLTRSTNQITDVITGITLDLKGSDADATINLNIDRDYTAIKTKISTFVSSYNAVMFNINEQFTYSEDEEGNPDTGALYADASLRFVKSTIRDQILSEVSGLDSDLNYLSLVGIESDKDGLLTVDDSIFDDYLENNLSEVVDLFAAHGTSANSDLSYVLSGNQTDSGSYEVEITTAATQASALGAGFSGSLGSDTTITITNDEGSIAETALSSGWDISSVTSAINSELSQEYNEIHVGANSLYTDAAHTTYIDEDTTWGGIDGVTLSQGDTISFGGLKRNGVVIAGEYTVGDTSTDTVQGFLSDIEAEFGSGYNAYIDNQGRIAIEDTTVGASSLSLNVTAAQGLDFGTIDIDPSGADGSHEGRHSMGDIVAANEGGQLKIYNDAYGDSSIDISGASAAFGIADAAYTGEDVAGRIREEGSGTWQTMTGDGQALTGDDDQAVEGLVLRYTGDSSGTFGFDFTTGMAEKMDRALYGMTDSIDGYVAGKQEALETRMDRMDERIDSSQRRLDLKEEMLTMQFTNMERLLSSLQNQQQWLSNMMGAGS